MIVCCRRITVGSAGDCDLPWIHRWVRAATRGPEGGPVPRGPAASSGPLGDRERRRQARHLLPDQPRRVGRTQDCLLYHQKKVSDHQYYR